MVSTLDFMSLPWRVRSMVFEEVFYLNVRGEGGRGLS